MPWKQGKKILLMNNDSNAHRNLASLFCKLNKHPALIKGYNEHFREIEDCRDIEEVPPDERNDSAPLFYLPHHPVIRDESTTSKIRPVFNASASGPQSAHCFYW